MINPRYETRTGKFGYYFYDREASHDMSLKEVLDLLNTANRIAEHTVELVRANDTLKNLLKMYVKGEPDV